MPGNDHQPVDTTIRNLDEDTYRRFKAWSVRHGKRVGEALTDAMESYLQRHERRERKHKFWEIPTTPGGPGAETASEDVDRIVYGKD